MWSILPHTDRRGYQRNRDGDEEKLASNVAWLNQGVSLPISCCIGPSNEAHGDVTVCYTSMRLISVRLRRGEINFLIVTYDLVLRNKL